jgi:hypothetical protein
MGFIEVFKNNREFFVNDAISIILYRKFCDTMERLLYIVGDMDL